MIMTYHVQRKPCQNKPKIATFETSTAPLGYFNISIRWLPNLRSLMRPKDSAASMVPDPSLSIIWNNCCKSFLSHESLWFNQQKNDFVINKMLLKAIYSAKLDDYPAQPAEQLQKLHLISELMLFHFC